MSDDEHHMPKHAQKMVGQKWAKDIAAMCVRNTIIEDIHAGSPVRSATGDYSDVKVVTPYGEIPWNDVERISQDEMKSFMKEVVNRLFTVFMNLDDHQFMDCLHKYGQRYSREWDEPQYKANWNTGKHPSLLDPGLFHDQV